MTQLKQLQRQPKNKFERTPMSNDDYDTGLEEYSKQAWGYAMHYLQMGWSIIPIRFSDKMPAIEWKRLQDEQPTEEEVTSWFEDGVPNGEGGVTRAFGLAVITGKLSGLVVVDCDNQDALTYAVTEANLFSMLTVATTRGQHLYFKHPGGSERVQNKAGGIGRDWPEVQGLDLRGDGGYVVAPPSVKFDADGKFKHAYSFNCPLDELDNFVSGLTVYPGMRIKAQQVVGTPGEMSFESLQLSAVKAYGATVWDDMAEKIGRMGRKMRDGDGRNPWLVRYVGECISTGMNEEQARVAAEQFEREFFEQPLPTVESETVVNSVLTIDKRNHPDKYAKREEYDNKNDTRKRRANALGLIRPNNLAELKRMSAGKQFLIDPFVPPQSIIQVVGFNGHGKSLWVLHTIWAAAKGIGHGSSSVTDKVRTLYLDFEGSATTLSDRIEVCQGMFGEMDDGLAIWNANVCDDDMCLNEGENISKLQALINDVQPQLIVIDTVRQAWSGMEENSPHSWVKVNDVAMSIRNAGMSVILVHHRNKPNMQGHGREAGSTAQLKDLDVQIIVTKVVEDMDQAKREAATVDSALKVTDFNGVVSTPWTYLRRAAPANSALRMVFELSYGKLRQATENHVTTYVGLAEDTITGKWIPVSSKTPMQKAVALSAMGKSIEEIALFTGVSQPTIKGWLTSKRSQ
jgi:hypothetical protein